MHKYQRLAKDRKLGKVPDREIGAKHGTHQSVVSAIRNSLGIEPYQRHDKGVGMQAYVAARQHKDLGKITDSAIAAQVGIATNAVYIIRVSAGVEPSMPRNGAGINRLIADPDLSAWFLRTAERRGISQRDLLRDIIADARASEKP